MRNHSNPVRSARTCGECNADKSRDERGRRIHSKMSKRGARKFGEDKVRDTGDYAWCDGTHRDFQMPGYSYPGYDYDGMFAWFSFRKSYIRLHVRPPVIQEHSKELAGYPTTKAIVSFPMDKPIPLTLVKKLVRASLKTMKDKNK
jgi:hypothetical protein